MLPPSYGFTMKARRGLSAEPELEYVSKRAPAVVLNALVTT